MSAASPHGLPRPALNDGTTHAPALTGARLNRELRRVLRGSRAHRATSAGRVLGQSLLAVAAATFLAWVPVACVAGIIRIITGG